MKGVSAGGSHAPQQWQTVINTHKPSDTNCTLRLASILPHSQSIHALCPRTVTFQQRNAIEQTRAMNRTGSEWESIEPDLECEPDPAGEGSRLAGGGMVCSGSLFAHKMSFLKPVICLATLDSLHSCLSLRSDSSATVWLMGNRRSQFQRYTYLKGVDWLLSSQSSDRRLPHYADDVFIKSCMIYEQQNSPPALLPNIYSLNKLQNLHFHDISNCSSLFYWLC